jgi:hypothetical protein
VITQSEDEWFLNTIKLLKNSASESLQRSKIMDFVDSNPIRGTLYEDM